ncbi:MAG: CHAP domain-containing protein [Rhizomicrobium sp.]
MNFRPAIKVVIVAGICALLGACTSGGAQMLTNATVTYAPAETGTTPPAPLADPRLFPDGDIDAAAPSSVPAGLQCVPYARAHSAVNIHGDAYTWWDKAAGVYARGAAPLLGAVMVMVNYAGHHHAHVAVVARLITPREIRIDHANWLNDGAVYTNDPVVDVSEANDWSKVKVWNIRTGSWGIRTYNVKGFIGPGPAGADANAVVAFNRWTSQAADPIARQISTAGTDLPAIQPASARSVPDGRDDDLLNDSGADR